ncbi:hypothetical protein, partial [Nonomuraea sp. LPB2021202275-12-8]|uniref:hypothetical protein n=1 Tax=Nonomuraea sp. LPB2021202275-12-8 TaxID=3120159 RepID=UPI00300CEA30
MARKRLRRRSGTSQSDAETSVSGTQNPGAQEALSTRVASAWKSKEMKIAVVGILLTALLAVLVPEGFKGVTKLFERNDEKYRIFAYYEGIEDYWAFAMSERVGQVPKGEWSGAILAGTQTLNVAFEGLKEKPVTVLQIRAKVLDRKAPPAGTVVVLYGQGGEVVRDVGIDLNDRYPVARTFKGKKDPENLKGPYFSDKVALLKGGEGATVFQVKIFPGRFLYKWVLEVVL